VLTHLVVTVLNLNSSWGDPQKFQKITFVLFHY